MLALIEIGAVFVWAITAGELFSYAAMSERREALVAASDRYAAVRRQVGFTGRNHEVIHPYAGYVHDPDMHEGADEHAWPHGGGVFDTVDEDFVVVVVGGSVAGQITGHLGDALVEAGLPRPVIVGTAEGGYKQPQQVAIVTYLLSVGARFDLLINVDGFNEAVLPVTDNMRFDVSPHYPRSWNQRFPAVHDIRTARRVGALVYWRTQRADVARWMQSSSLRHSVTANVVWSSWDRHADAEIERARAGLRSQRGQRTYQSHGPRPPATEAETMAEAARVWSCSSILLDQLARANGIAYLHVLQPNQYLPDSKPFSDEEREAFIRTDSTYGAVAADGYAALFDAAPRIVEAGVDYHDLTRLFAEDGRTLYEDDCCHFNETGRRLLAARIAELAAARLAPTLAPAEGEPAAQPPAAQPPAAQP